ncbi:fructose-1,6-bisphosphatase, cytosolic-like [Hibiscus syriacus]|uniref:ubiquitinyl hydrolase 1 n=1 Tax=Hibiscus syriacus TaxID=106335 RepID=A0A6A2YTC1_HIBSY|nr:fructose-1,6-bisphosphatase, cytosolic-like [Hibiscus syriacus]
MIESGLLKLLSAHEIGNWKLGRGIIPDLDRALVKRTSILCGNNERAVIATLSVVSDGIEGSEGSPKDVKVLRVDTFTSSTSAFKRLEAIIPIFQSRMGALLFLISALLSRGLDCVKADQDDPSLPLVTAPFGHASQEIVNLLLCGQAVPNVFDGRMDLGGGMFLKGIPTSEEVGFLTLLESLNFFLFAWDTAVQDEYELEGRELQVRKAFDARDQSGGGGFISVEAFHQVLRETSIRLPSDKLDSLCGSGFIVWSEFWNVILDLDKNMGSLTDSTGQMVRGESPIKRPRLTKLRVSVTPRWTSEEFMTDAAVLRGTVGSESSEVAKPEQPPQHAPLVDCIRTRWPRAVCNWIGDAPGIV